MLKPWSPEVENEAGDGGYQDTICLLQEEIARLEDELRARNEATIEANRAHVEERVDAIPADFRSLARVDQLGADLAGREETIVMLLEQNRLLEEAEEAGREEWNQLHRWVEEVERRLDGREGSDRDVEDRLRAERSARESLQTEIEIDRRAWKSWRDAAENEIARLRAREAESGGSTQSSEGLSELESENRRLRQECLDFQKSTATVAEVGFLRTKLDAARGETAELERKYQLVRDELECERKRHEVEMASARSRFAREALARNNPASGSTSGNNDLSPDERIRAFREHLRELHVDESKQKEKRGLTNRLARLWNRTSPGS